MAIDFFNLIETLKVEAIANKLAPTEISDFRYFCRQYSQKFHTPLHMVLEMSPEFVISTLFESQLDGIDVEENIETILEQVYTIENPEYEKIKEEELDNFVKKIEKNEEEKSLKKKQKKESEEKTLLENDDLEKSINPPAGLPTSGFLNLSYLENSENER